MWKKTGILAIWSSLMLAALVTLGAGPRQGGLPSQPFFPDTVSGRVTLQGKPAPANTTLVACIDDCITVFESASFSLYQDGSFRGLKVDALDQRLVGHQVGFYLVNEFGWIRASETVMFLGAAEMHTADLAFSHPYADANPHGGIAFAGRPGGDGDSQNCFDGGSGCGGSGSIPSVPGQTPGLLAARF